MKRKFVNVIVFGSLILAAGGMTVGCSDYDDDIDGLQEQVDNIKGATVSPEELAAAVASAKAEYEQLLQTAVAGKAENASVTALQSKVEELVNALNNKSDAATVEGILSEIASLSEEVNAAKGDLADLSESLQQDVEDLQKAIASSETATKDELNSRLNAEIAELNSKISEVDGSMASKVSDLTSQITALQGRISNAESADEELLGQLATLNSQLESLKAEAATKGELGDLVSRVAALETAKYMTEDEVRSLLQSELTAKLADVETRLKTVEDFMNNNAANIAKLTQALATIKNMEEVTIPQLQSLINGKADASDIASAITDLKSDLPTIITNELTQGSYAKLSDIDSKITTALADYYTKSQVYSKTEIDQKLSMLDVLGTVKSSTLDAVFAGVNTTDEHFRAYATLLTDVANLEAKFAEGGDFATLSKEFTEFKSEYKNFISAANAAVQSIVFVPEYTDRSVIFSRLVLDRSASFLSSLPIISETEKVVKFRVTPAAAAKELLDENKYAICFSGSQQTKRTAMKGNEFIEPKSIEADTETGIVTVKIAPSTANTNVLTDHYSAISMNVKAVAPKTESGDDILDQVLLTDVASDYFTLGVETRNVSKVYVQSPADNVLSIKYNEGWSRDYAAGRTFVDQYGQSLSQFDMESVGRVSYSCNNTTNFALSGGVLSFTTVGQVAAIDQKVKVTAAYTFNAASNFNVGTKEYSEVTVVKAITERKFEYTIPNVEWAAASKTYTLDMAAVNNASGLAPADFLALSSPTETTVTCGMETLKIAGDLTNGLSVTIPSYINMATANGKTLSWKYVIDELTTFEIIVHLPATTIMPEVEILRNPSWWSGNHMTVSAIETTDAAGKINGINLQALDYETKAYSNYLTMKSAYASLGLLYTVGVNIPLPLGIVDNGSAITVDKSSYRGATVGISAKIALDKNNQNAVLASDNGTIEVPMLCGEWTVEKTMFTTNRLVGTVNMAEGCTWKSRNGDIMWKAGRLYDGTDVDDAFVSDPMAIYGLTAPYFVITSDPDNLATIDSSTGMLTFKSSAADFVLAKDYTITVKCTVKSQWGTYAKWVGNTNQGISYDLTLTIPAN